MWKRLTTPHKDTHAVFDIETNDKDKSAVHLVHVISIKPYGELCETYSDHPLTNVLGSLKDGVERLRSFPMIIGHNIINYDLPVLRDVLGYSIPKHQLVFDTLITSRYLNPDRPLPIGYPYKTAPHSLDAWGYRLGRFKPEHTDWSVISDDMIHRNREDCEITELLLDYFLNNDFKQHDWSLCNFIEHEVARIITKQEETGVPFDVARANELVNKLESCIEHIDTELLPRLPSTVKPWGVSITQPFKINGDLKKSVYDWFWDCEDDIRSFVCGAFTRIEYIPFKLSSQPQVKDFLLSIGWKPTEWNYDSEGNKSSPKLTEDSFESLTGDTGSLFKKRFLYSHRLSQVTGWLERVRPDGRLSAKANTCGTPTGRFRHSVVVNVPKAAAHVEFGKEMRALFTRSSPQRKLCGHDASGLELRMLAHYMNDYLFTEAVINGKSSDGTDIHTVNQKLAALPTRDAAKTFIYAFIYGAGDAKLGSIVEGSSREGKEMRKKFLEGLPSLEDLISSTKKFAKKGYVLGLDGRKVWMRRNDDGTIIDHKALNTQLQSAGAIVMKVSMILLEYWCNYFKINADKVLDMHDEAQADVVNRHVDLYLYLAKESIVQAGQLLKLNVPLAADAVAGTNWAETH